MNVHSLDYGISNTQYAVSVFGTDRQTSFVGEQGSSLIKSLWFVTLAGRIRNFTGGMPSDLEVTIKSPFNLEITEDDDGSFIISDLLFGVYGEGADPGRAFEDYRAALIDYLLLLKERSANSKEDGNLYETASRHVEIKTRGARGLSGD
jgi:hypothetical protein